MIRRIARFRRVFRAALAGCLTLIVFGCGGLTQGELITLHALSHLDAPYVFSAAGPDRFDCSGLIRHCMAREGFAVPHSAEQIGAGAATRLPGGLMVGDILCFDTVRDRDPSDHVGFYMGGGQFVHASSAKGRVIVSDLDGFYLEKFTGAKRIAQVWF